MPKRSLQEAVTWLKNLDTQIRKYHPPRSRREAGFNQTLRNLTHTEWAMITDCIKEHELPCMLYAGPYGFCLAVHEPAVVQGVQPDLLLCIENMQFPFPSGPKGFAGQDETLRLLEPITHTDRNKQLLAWCGFEALREATSYAY